MALKDSLSKVGGSLANIAGSLVKVFDDGSKIYLSVRGRIAALKQIESETVNKESAVVNAPALDLTFNERNKTILGAVGLVLVGVAVVKFVR